MKVLIIDDKVEIRDLIVQFLGYLGHSAVVAASGKEGLKLFAENLDIDIVITDRQMPGGMLGEEVVREIKKISPQTKVVLMSGDDPEEVFRVAKVAGADIILLKPFLLEELAQALSE